MSTLGPFCQSAGITVDVIESQKLQIITEIPNGLALELKAYCDGRGYTLIQFVSLLRDINPDFQNASAPVILNKLKYVKDQKKKLVHKKKVKGIKNVTELLNKTFSSPVPNSTQRPTIIPSTKDTTSSISPIKTCESTNVQSQSVKVDLNKSVQTEASADSLKSEVKDLNVMQYKTRIQEHKLNKLKEELTSCQENLQNLKGHYSVKNVNKRDETARRNLHKLRECQRTVIKQDRMLKLNALDQSSFASLKRENEKLKRENMGLKDTVESLSDRIDTEIAKKIMLQKSNSYLKIEIANLRSQVQSSESVEKECDCSENMIKMKFELSEKEQRLSELEEKLEEVKVDSVKTKNEKGMYNENIRLCIMELAGLEVATEKMSPVIKAVVSHVLGKKIDDLPNATSSQKIIDEGHY